jgi:2-oxoglutarate/2-oxoacid ferredoxin oxidoreductase subunit alpha
MAELNYLVGGEAGQGVQTIGLVLSKTLARHGLDIFADQDYESRVRGGHSFFRVRASEVSVGAYNPDLDVLVCLDQKTADVHHGELKKDGIVIYDPDKITAPAQGKASAGVAFEKIATETSGNKIMANSVATGAALAISGYDSRILENVLSEEFNHMGGEVVEGNIKAARAGHEYINRHASSSIRRPIQSDGQKKMLIDGNGAIALGALAAGCRFVAGYPMTPTSSILEYIADKGRKYNVVMLQPEDEIAAINMVVGAAYAGVRAMTATSGGGFCLMVEGISLAGMTETPIVCVLGQRAGPAIGLPTRTEQGELFFSIFSGHGDFPKAVFSPPTIEDCFHATVSAFNLAERYQTPVIILTDHHIASSLQTVSPFDLSKVEIDRGEFLTEKDAAKLVDYKRHQFTESGVSPRAYPFSGGPLIVTDSDEHDEAGHMIEDALLRTQMMDKRMKKMEGMKQQVLTPWYINKPGADLILVGWGSTFGAIHEAAIILNNDGVRTSVLQLPQVWPFPADAVVSAIGRNGTRSIVVENNATAQLANLIRMETGISVNHSILKYDGRPYSADLIGKEAQKELR